MQPYPKLWLVAEPRNGPLLEFPIWPCTRRGFPCPVDFSPGGGLLHHLFTLTRPLRAGRFVFCGTFRQHVLKRAAPVYSWRTGITWRRALWCSDFPPPQVEAILRSPETSRNIAYFCLRSQTSATSRTRPFPPRPDVGNQVSSSPPLAVIAAGRSNSRISPGRFSHE